MRALLSLPAILALSTLLLALAVWFVGPLIPLGGEPRWLDPWPTRATVIAVLVALAGLILAIRWLLRRRRNAKLVEDLSAPDPRAERMSAEAEALRAKFAAAMRDLRRLTFRGPFGGRRYLYELPWYVFIGPPASGKTTALLNADLGDPLKRGEKLAVEGAGGTADCDWMFTDDAVFLDTAGRYVTQDSDAEVDRSAWTAFLDLVVRHRPEEALNGVIVAISIEEIAAGDPARLAAHAEAVRRGVQEIMAKMQAEVPVYVMFTKMDLLKGFNEFFQRLDRDGREQVWGVTFPLEGRAAEAPRQRAEADLASVEAEFDRLLERLGEMQFERVQAEADLGVRADVFGFPSQFSSLRAPVARFLREAFSPDRYSQPIRLRGFHFTSATQQGQPIDRLIASLSREFGIERRATPFLSGGTGRAYFLKGLLRDVVFPEAGLAASGARRRRAVLTAGRWAAILACIAVPAALAFGWSRVEGAMRAEADALVAAMAAYEGELAALEGTPIPRPAEDALAGETPVFDPARVSDDHVELALAPLSHLAAARERLAAAEPPLPLNGLGLADYDSLRAQADFAYLKALDDLMRTRLLFGLERRMDDLIDDPAALHEALKTYLMVGGRASRAEIDPEFVRAEIAALQRARLPEAEAERLNAALAPHLDAMLEGMRRGLIRPRSLNETKLEQVRAVAAEARPAERAYGILKARVAAMGLPDWTIRDAPRGRAAEGVLIRASGEDVFAPIPALLTYRGYWEGARPLFDAAVAQALEEKWVLAARDDPAEATPIERREAEARIRDLYAADYVAAWQGLLDDLRIAPFADAGQAAQILRVLASLDSPLRNVLTEAARQTHLDRAPETAAGQAGGLLDAAREGGVGGRVTSAADRARRAAGAGGGPAGPDAAARVSEAFAPLRDFVGSADQGSPLDELVNRLAELREVVSAIEGRRASLDDLVGNPVVASVQNTADAGPPFLRRMASEMAQTFETTVAGGLRAGLNERWRAEVAPFCQQRLAGRYPFGGGEDAALGDVAEVLGPGGLIDDFFRRNLAGMVDTQSLEWRWKDLGLALGIPVETLRMFQTAARLRDAFFPGGAQLPGFAFGVRPEAFDPEVSAMALAVGGDEKPFLRDDPTPAQLAWPGPVPDQGAVVTMQVLGGGRDISGAPLPATEAEQAQIGAWGLFRLLDRSGFGRLGSGERVRVRLRAGGRSVTAILSMSSPENPLALRREMGAFRCPASL